MELKLIRITVYQGRNLLSALIVRNSNPIALYGSAEITVNMFTLTEYFWLRSGDTSDLAEAPLNYKVAFGTEMSHL